MSTFSRTPASAVSSFALPLCLTFVSVAVAGCSGDAFSANDPQPAGGAASGASGAGGSGVSAAAGGASGQGGAIGGNGGAAGDGLGGVSSGGAGHGGGADAGHSGASGGGGPSSCVAGAFHCNGDVLQACDPKTGFVDLQACPAGLCDDKKGRCETCHPGDVLSCKDSATQLVCGSDGINSTPKACGASAPYCVDKGSCVECTTAAECSAPAQTCYEAQCNAHACSAVASKQGTVIPPVGGKPTHDCTKVVCNGTGGTMKVADPTNLPVDDGSGCAKAVCNGETPGYVPLDAGTSCGGDAVCTGTGKCGVCVPGTTGCLGNGVQTCGAEGTWVGSATECLAPTPVCSEGTCQTVQQVSLGAASCALIGDGSVRCWGSNIGGSVGVPITADAVLEPTRVVGLPKILTLAGGSAGHTCALDASGAAWCWGRNDEGQLGDGTHGDAGAMPSKTSSPTPVRVKTDSKLSQICLGYWSTCALTVEGEVLCWGLGVYGETGVVSTLDADHASLPGSANSTPIVGIKSLHCGGAFTCALGSDGLFCWGDNVSGELGAAATGDSIADPPQKITGQVTSMQQSFDIDFTQATSVALGGASGCAFIGNYGVVCWGNGDWGQLGNGVAQGSAALVSADVFNLGADFSDTMKMKMSAGGAVTCVVDPVSELACVGADDSGQLGDGSAKPPPYSTSLVRPLGIKKGTTQLVTDGSTSCALNGGQLLCWGYNHLGQVGIGSLVPFVAAPTPVAW